MRAAFRFLSLTGSTSLSYSSLLTTPSLSKSTNFTARADATDVAAAVPDTDWAQQAGWLAGLASGVADVPASEPPVAPSGVWAAALAEQKEVDSVDARIERLRRK